jgi:hypothetical protein
MVCHLFPRTILIQDEKFKDLDELLDTSWTKATLEPKLRDVFGYFAFFNVSPHNLTE